MDCCNKLSFEETNCFSKPFVDYVNGEEYLKPFYGESPSLEAFKRQIEKKSSFSSETRSILVKSLLQQYNNIDDSPVEVIQSLQDEKTFTITTGHQLNIFTGPLYFIFKIVTVINMAKKLQKEFPEYRFIPVYWMATEDHDFDEISFFNFRRKKYLWNYPNPNGPVGRFNLEGIDEILKSFYDMPEVFKKAYTQFDCLSDAVRYYVHELFKDEGLICVDGDDVELKKLLKPVIHSDLFEGKPFQLVEKTDEQLIQLGCQPQIYARPINFFYMEDGLRERIEQEGDTFKVVNTNISWRESELRELVDQSPEKFSPNVVLRPLYQEIILPNLSYTGGPAEMIYWLQLKSVFENFEVPFPILLPRNFGMIVNDRQLQKLDSLHFSLNDLFEKTNVLRKKIVELHSDKPVDLTNEKNALLAIYDQMEEKASTVDATVVEHIKGERKRLENRLKRTQRRMLANEERHLEEHINMMHSLKETFFPKGGLQERSDNFLNFYLEDENFIQALKQQFDPLNMEFYILKLR